MLEIENKTYEAENFSDTRLPEGRYENCKFRQCIFQNGHLSNISFVDCLFESCDLSNTQVKATAFKEVSFQGSKIIGVDFHKCDPFLLSISFSDCTLDYAVFLGLKLKNTRFRNCSIKEADFTNAILAESIFDNCNLERATFHSTDLSGTDFRTSFNYAFDPDLNSIRKAKFSKEGLPGLLAKYGIIIS